LTKERSPSCRSSNCTLESGYQFFWRKEVWCTEVHVFDFFAGPGTDADGTEGSPLRLLRKLQEAQRDPQRYPGWSQVSVYAHLFDAKAKNVSKLRQVAVPLGHEIPGLQLEVDRVEFNEALSRSSTVLRNPRAAKLLLIDQFGVDSVTADVFKTLVEAPKCDFLFFLSSSTLSRFRDHPAIKQKIVRPDDPYHIHRAALDYYRGLLPNGSTYYLAPFSIKKEVNIYGLIFGSPHPLGMDKFLQVAWKRDEVNGEANFDIGRDNVMPDQPKLDLEIFGPTKLIAFERELETGLRGGGFRDDVDVIRACFRWRPASACNGRVVSPKKGGRNRIGLSRSGYRPASCPQTNSPLAIVLEAGRELHL